MLRNRITAYCDEVHRSATAFAQQNAVCDQAPNLDATLTEKNRCEMLALDTPAAEANLDRLADDSHGLSFAQVGDVVTLAVTIARKPKILALMQKEGGDAAIRQLRPDDERIMLRWPHLFEALKTVSTAFHC